MKNVLIISYNFPPLNNIAAKRYGHMAKYFQGQGWIPWVLTTNSLEVESDGELEGRIIRIGQHPQESERVDKLNAANTIKGWPHKLHATLCNFNFRLRAVDRYLFTWYREVLSQVEEISVRLPKIDLIVASYGPATALWLGRKLAKLYKVPWIADYRDLGALHPLERSKFSQFVDQYIERFMLSSSVKIITVSETLACMFSRAYSKKCEVVYNGWDKDDWGEGIEKVPDEMPPHYIYYAGSFYKHQMDSIKMLISALKELNHNILVIRSLGPQGLEDEIKEFIANHEAQHVVTILPSSPLSTIYHEAQHSRANLIVEDLCTEHEWSKGTLTGKLFTLMPLKPPILCIARRDSDIGKILDITQKGKLVSSVKSVKEYVLRLDENVKVSVAGNKSIGQYTRGMQAKKMTQIFDAIAYK